MIEPLHIISLGAGVQSSVMALMAAAGEISPMPACAVFADTQAEPASVYRWLDWLEKRLPFPVYRVTKGSLIKDITTVRRRKDDTGNYVHSNIPAFTINPDGSHGMIPRQCTSTFKIEPLDRFTKKFCGCKRQEKKIRCIQWIGISLDEISRMRDSRNKWQSNRYPLVDARMNRNDCLRWMYRQAMPEPPRSSCVFCPYHSDHEWRRLRDEEPAEFARAVRVEKAFQKAKTQGGLVGDVYFHASRKPLDTVDFSSEEDRGQLSMFNNECEGMCGV